MNCYATAEQRDNLVTGARTLPTTMLTLTFSVVEAAIMQSIQSLLFVLCCCIPVLYARYIVMET